MMSGFFSFIGGLIELVLFVFAAVGVIAFFGYNGLRTLSESIHESMSNIGVVSRKQASLVNQLIDVVKGYQESEKLVMLKVSEDVSATMQAAQIYQQSNLVLAAASGIAQKFPELKSNLQYSRLIDSIQSCEGELENARQRYNSVVKSYNVKRKTIPQVFYAATLGFKIAPYLEFVGESQMVDMGTIKSFSSEDDSDRLNVILGMVGSKAMEIGSKAIDNGRLLAGAAQEKIIHLSDKKFDERKSGESSEHNKVCFSCGQIVNVSDVFCAACGARVNDQVN